MDYYGILQIEENATQNEIKQAYHKMARLFHPDNFNGSKEEAAEQMAKVNEAYKILSDTDKRAVYDADRQLKKDRANFNDKSNINERNNKSSETSEAGSANKNSSTEPKATYFNTDNPPIYNNQSNKGCSSCLAKIIEWAIYIVIIYFIINHFNLADRAKKLLNTFNQSQYSSEEKNETKLAELKPEEVVEYYFQYIKEGKNGKANKLFDVDADENFETCTVAEYNKAVTDLYYGFEEDIPTYPLFEEIRNFNYSISDVKLDRKKKSADVSIEIENCDIYLLFSLILEDDADKNKLETLSDSKIQKLIKNAIEQYKDICMINTEATFTLKRDSEGCWKIESISPLKDFSIVIVGQANDIIRILSEEDISNDS